MDNREIAKELVRIAKVLVAKNKFLDLKKLLPTENPSDVSDYTTTWKNGYDRNVEAYGKYLLKTGAKEWYKELAEEAKSRGFTGHDATDFIYNGYFYGANFHNSMIVEMKRIENRTDTPNPVSKYQIGGQEWEALVKEKDPKEYKEIKRLNRLWKKFRKLDEDLKDNLNFGYNLVR